ncbi:hypothetical protein LMH87_009757 [Akanthomyces muscarius]|uniref:Zn(2)-C6 fungal-type domain-containing protein n=1 Tax=Akanthomyces muscarius TaxID=2231603 RepID=A0A9W8QDL1_AKAMU|nr:hypothetical protein LMH87_009757 [Akanthomyces muscarius]KAJ4153262.1 hypothetical protein LMH87_009757 [Akanthomyces muscarius]
MGRQPRQRPISCKLCRQRKLRCSRIFPCSNCTCRGLVCEHDGPVTAQASAPRSSLAASSSANGSVAAPDHDDANMRMAEEGQSAAPKDVPNAELLARLEKLEALIAAQNREGMLNKPEPTAYSEAPAPNQPSAVASPMSPQLQKLTDDALWLERSFTGQPMLEPLCDPISFRTCPVRRIVKQGSYVLQNDPSAPSFGSGEVTRCIWLPRRDEARIIAHKYISDIYDCVDSNSTLDIGLMTMLLSMCAAATYTWSPQDDARLLFGTVAEARAQALWWVKAALDVMDHAQRIGHASLECIHGMVILFYVFCNIEGLSPRARSLNSRSISMARELSLHRVDAPSNRDVADMGSLRLEMSRRTWWFLVATDWMVTQFAFPQEGSFTIHPFHMMVRKPSNVNDIDIVDSQPVIGRPLTEPTDASALIYRIRLAELCQNMLDKDRAYAFQAQPADHKFVMEMDNKFRVYLRELPDFLSMDSTNMHTLSPSDPRRDPKITIQRYTLNLLIYRHLCKLHLPFLARGSVEQSYSYSYEACMAAARMIIQTEKHLKLEDLPFSSTRLRSVVILRSVFLASIALVLNACIGRQTEETPANDSHLVEAWRIMDDAKDQSPIGAKLLDLSVQVLKRHTPNHPALKMFTALPVTMPMTPDSAGREEQRRNMPFQGFVPEPEASYMDQQWQALEGRVDLNTIDFDKLFYGLEAPFI